MSEPYRFVERAPGAVGGRPPLTRERQLRSETFAQSVHLFLAAIAQGLPAAGAMEALGTLGRGSFSHDDKCFYPESAALGPIADRIGVLPTARRLVVRGCEGEGDTTAFLLAGAVAAIVSDKALRAAWADGPRRRKEGLEAL
jgi:hypothetical protein